MKQVLGQALRFAVIGVANTLGTSLLLWLLTFVMPGVVAYAIAYAAGILFASLVTGRYVFRTSATRGLMLAYGALYTVVFFIGFGILSLALSLGMSDRYSFVVVIVTAPLNFLGGRIVFSRRSARLPSQDPKAPASPNSMRRVP